MSAPLRDLSGDFDQDHNDETRAQIIGATDALFRDDDEWVSWPWPDVTALLGRMKPRDVWFACGFSGNGKTLFVTSAVQEWIKQQVKVYVLPLETAADDFRLYLACQNVGIDPGVINSGRLLDMGTEQRAYWERKVGAELERQLDDPAVRPFLKVKGVDSITLARLTLAAEEAADWNARVVIVDHIDHIKDGDGTNAFAESTRVNLGAKELAKRFNLIFLFTSQMNNEAIRGGRDRLAQYGPPMPHHVYMGGHKRMIATGMIGLHRRLRDQQSDESLESYHAALKKSRDGDAPPLDALEPGVMALTAMKLRNDGSREGQRAFLSVHHGRITDLPERDHYATTYDATRRI